MRGLGLLLLSIWLIGSGIMALVNLAIPAAALILALIALAAGVLLLIEGLRTSRRAPNSWAMMLLGVWLIVSGLLSFINVPNGEIILAGLGIIVGGLILLRR